MWPYVYKQSYIYMRLSMHKQMYVHMWPLVYKLRYVYIEVCGRICISWGMCECGHRCINIGMCVCDHTCIDKGMYACIWLRVAQLVHVLIDPLTSQAFEWVFFLCISLNVGCGIFMDNFWGLKWESHIWSWNIGDELMLRENWHELPFGFFKTITIEGRHA